MEERAARRLAAALHPFPTRCLGLLLKHFGGSPQVAAQALEAIGTQALAEDVEEVWEKLRMVFRDFFSPGETPGPVGEWELPNSIVPSVESCGACGQGFSPHTRKVPITVFSSAVGAARVEAVERHCSSCFAFFLGPWRYVQKGDAGGGFQNLEYVHVGAPPAVFFLPSSRHRAFGMRHRDLRLVTGILLRARGSFAAVADI